jgi:FkbM family methyltransferase
MHPVFHKPIYYLKSSIIGPAIRKINHALSDPKKEAMIKENQLLQERQYDFKRNNDSLLINLARQELKLRNGSSDYKVFKQVFINGEYKPLLDIVDLNRIEVKNIIDAGANIGLSTNYFLERFPGAQIICIEPDKSNFKTLEFNVRQRRSNVRLYNKALWYKNEILYLTDKFRDGEDWSRSISTSNENSLSEVEAITVDDLIKGNSLATIDLFKIDIEGAEFDLYKNSSDLDYLNNTKVIAIEVHKEINSPQIIIDILRKYGFILFEYSETLVGINKKFLQN